MTWHIIIWLIAIWDETIGHPMTCQPDDTPTSMYKPKAYGSIPIYRNGNYHSNHIQPRRLNDLHLRGNIRRLKKIFLSKSWIFMSNSLAAQYTVKKNFSARFIPSPKPQLQVRILFEWLLEYLKNCIFSVSPSSDSSRSISSKSQQPSLTASHLFNFLLSRAWTCFLKCPNMSDATDSWFWAKGPLKILFVLES